jgi:hypothetical protein
MERGVKLPDGVENPRRPVETGQLYFSTTSTETVIFCVDLSMSIRIEDPTGLVAFAAAAAAELAGFSSQTSALSFHDMPARSQSFFVRGCGLAAVSGAVRAVLGPAPQTLAVSFHDHPDAAWQSARVKG